MATFAGQAGAPIVAAIARSGDVTYAEAVSSMPAKSVTSEMRAAIDEFNERTAVALRGAGARRAKSVFLVNPADPPMPIRITLYCLVTDGPADERRIEADVLATVDRVRKDVPGCRVKHRVQCEGCSLHIPESGDFSGTRVTVLLEIADAEHHAELAGATG
ncbi:hypothetical protein BST27_04460 [Mycobacterium intermedium]|uniref:Acetaldehyde dehydrogenase C-terminal domain-containing protein n=1 Tax=Mycobacterium intermedium TaxID=28445 RepID=A0A1E3SFS9_MYCIE|nr:hypothetical protein [Mycobacterium intermedium]MCV6966191.1 hypothetical protein [Mycobacterium intermedium]ODR00922.1 hypothetical protein BHQ20_11010 [Mycobacterium intermedium]OPE48776.1 hypothetical protein BV508_16830 [Mycobacterium intermedium]ORB09815.1 hypothetical protein BST27_04460 [Mycobacterium intermedium]